MRNKVVLCGSCDKQSETDDILKSCGNCFGCVGCEIYICPHCENQIVVKPLNTKIEIQLISPTARQR